jgi:DNA-binding PadR family transcriptional regulator
VTGRDESTLLRAVDQAGRNGGHFWAVRRGVNAPVVRVHVGLGTLESEGLVSERRGPYAMAVYRLTLEGRQRLEQSRRQRGGRDS